jgi:hypothetical protein
MKRAYAGFGSWALRCWLYIYIITRSNQVQEVGSLTEYNTGIHDLIGVRVNIIYFEGCRRRRILAAVPLSNERISHLDYHLRTPINQ